MKINEFLNKLNEELDDQLVSESQVISNVETASKNLDVDKKITKENVHPMFFKFFQKTYDEGAGVPQGPLKRLMINSFNSIKKNQEIERYATDETDVAGETLFLPKNLWEDTEIAYVSYKGKEYVQLDVYPTLKSIGGAMGGEEVDLCVQLYFDPKTAKFQFASYGN